MAGASPVKSASVGRRPVGWSLHQEVGHQLDSDSCQPVAFQLQSRWEGGGKSEGGREVKCKIESTSAVILLLILVLNLVLSLNPDSDPGS